MCKMKFCHLQLLSPSFMGILLVLLTAGQERRSNIHNRTEIFSFGFRDLQCIMLFPITFKRSYFDMMKWLRVFFSIVQVSIQLLKIANHSAFKQVFGPLMLQAESFLRLLYTQTSNWRAIRSCFYIYRWKCGHTSQGVLSGADLAFVRT